MMDSVVKGQLLEQGAPRGRAHGFRLSPIHIDAYLRKLEGEDYAPQTLQSYRRALERLYGFLPEDKWVQAGTLAAWQAQLLDAGYSTQTVNVCTAAANSLMAYLRHKEFLTDRLPEKETLQPELTRAEYLRLLSAARLLGREKTYLLVKVFGTTGLSVGDVEHLTAEAVRAGKITLPAAVLRIPEGLREELIHFMEAEGIASGPVFLAANGKPQGRTVLTNMIKALCQEARVAEEKANPRCLRRLYQATQADIQQNLSLLIEQAYDRLLEKEQNAVGWERNF